MRAATLNDEGELDDKIRSAGENLRKGAGEVQKDLRATANTASDDLEGIARHVGRQVREMAVSAEDSVVEFSGSVSKKIHEKPVQSSVIALAVGIVLGFLFRR
jgi:ElaB/YqjD/DUF883 family membrane-anchored ribosome-binding protein